MNRYKCVGILCVLLAGLFVSCYEDKGNYDYDWIQDVVWKKEMKDTLVQRGNVLKIEPDLARLSGVDSVDLDTSAYTYLWEAWWDNKNSAVLSTSKDLNDTIWLATGKSYQVNYRVTEKATGISWMNHFNLKVINWLNDGYLLMTEDDERRVELEVHGKDAVGNVVHETGVLGRSGFPYSGGGAKWLSCNRLTSGSNRSTTIWLATGQAAGWLTLPDFTWSDRQLLRLKMLIPEPLDYSLNSIAQTDRGMVFMTGEGNIHIFNSRDNLILADAAYLNKKKFLGSPYAGMGNNGAIFYNQSDSCFVFYKDPMWMYYTYGISKLDANVAYEGSTLYCMQNVNGTIVAVIKNRSGKYLKLMFYFSGSTMNPKITVNEYAISDDFAMIEDAEDVVIAFATKKIYFTLNKKLFNYRDSGVDECKEVTVLSEDQQKIDLDPVEALINIPRDFKGSCEKIFISTYSKENKGRVYITHPDPIEPMNLIVDEIIPTDGKVKNLCRWAN